MRQKSMDKKLLSEQRRQVRKEKSKVAARSRRGKECEVFSELIDTLPIADTVKAALDKTTIIRLCINYIRSRNLLGNVCNDDYIQTSPELEMAIEETMAVLHGFVIMLSPTGEVIYATSNVKQLLGIREYDMIGQSLEAFIHPADKEEMKENIKTSNTSLAFSARIKSNLSSKSRSSSFKSSAYKMMRFSGKLLQVDVKPTGSGMTECILLTATPIEHPSVGKMPLDTMSFTSKHTLDMKLSDCDQHATDLTGYTKSYLAEKSFYDFIHPSDIRCAVANFKALTCKEHIVTDHYRFLTAGGGYVNMSTQASLATDHKTSQPLHILCVHRVISDPVDVGVIMADIQMVESRVKVKHEVARTACARSAKPYQLSGVPAAVREEVNVLDDIIDATAGVFMDPVEDACDLDIMRDTESIFGDDPSISGVSGKCALEALVEELDNDTVDMNRGLFVDLSDADEKDYYLRAPYIPMEDYSDMPIIESWCYDETTSLSQSKQQDWSLYRQEEGQQNSPTLASPVSSFSPGKSNGTHSPAADDSPPWLIDNDSNDLIYDLAQLTYTENDHGSYSKSSETDFNSLPDMKNCFNERLAFSNSEVQQPPSTREQTWSPETYIVDSGSAGMDMSRVPSVASLGYQSPQGQQYGYTRRKRKVDEQFGMEIQSPMKANRNLDQIAVTETTEVGVAKGSGQRLVNGSKEAATSYLAAQTSPGVVYANSIWNDWDGMPGQSNCPQQTRTVNGGISKKSAPLDNVRQCNTGWYSTTSHTSGDVKYKPTLQGNSATAIDRDKQPKEVTDSLLLNLLQQT